MSTIRRSPIRSPRRSQIKSLRKSPIKSPKNSPYKSPPYNKWSLLKYIYNSCYDYLSSYTLKSKINTLFKNIVMSPITINYIHNYVIEHKLENIINSYYYYIYRNALSEYTLNKELAKIYNDKTDLRRLANMIANDKIHVYIRKHPNDFTMVKIGILYDKISRVYYK